MTIEIETRTAADPNRPHHEFPPFEPHPLLRGGHLQTLGGHLIPKRPIDLPADRHELELADGDRLRLYESASPDTPPDRPIAVIVHGLAGHAGSHYQLRFSDRLLAIGLRVVRVNLRSAGTGLGLARGIYHGGRSEDLRTVLEWIARRYPEAPIGTIGLSLGGNIALKLAGEAADRPVPNLDCVVAANPPIDLSLCCNQMKRFPLQLYDRFFVRRLVEDIRRLHDLVPDLGPVRLERVRSMLEFDERYTAPRCGFAGAEDYYRRASAAPVIPAIRLPGLVVHALDDPFIPADPFFSTEFPSQIRLELATGGGHLGYLSRRRWGNDHRWLDARLAGWLADRWGLVPDPPESSPETAAGPGIVPAAPEVRSCPEPPGRPRSSAPPSRC